MPTKSVTDSYKIDRYTGWKEDAGRTRSLRSALQAACGDEVEIDLDWLGTDAGVMHRVSADVALYYGIVPVCELDGELVIAVCSVRAARARKELPALLGKKLRFVIADAAVIAHTIDTNYSPLQLTA